VNEDQKKTKKQKTTSQHKKLTKMGNTYPTKNKPDEKPGTQ
jgi:hypothetical protein